MHVVLMKTLLDLLACVCEHPSRPQRWPPFNAPNHGRSRCLPRRDHMLSRLAIAFPFAAFVVLGTSPALAQTDNKGDHYYISMGDSLAGHVPSGFHGYPGFLQAVMR